MKWIRDIKHDAFILIWKFTEEKKYVNKIIILKFSVDKIYN
jgi:hypothetical protein